MKALTLWQPWATLVAVGAKKIETRSWGTNCRGPLAIHAAKTSSKEARLFFDFESFRQALRKRGYRTFEQLPAGAVVAICELSDCRQIQDRTDWPDNPELSFGDYAPGRYMWMLGRVKRLAQPVPARGKQGIWEWESEEIATMPMNRADYPDDWEELSHYIRFDRAGGCCEGSPAYPDCRARHGEPHPVTGSRVVLTVGHLDHDTTNNDPSNLKAWCQRCHLTYDAGLHARNAAETRRLQEVEAGQLEIWMHLEGNGV